jgi:UDP-galactopyranose mutase
MRRFAADFDVIYWEEPVFLEGPAEPCVRLKICERSGVVVATPAAPHSLCGEALEGVLAGLLQDLVVGRRDLVFWFYTPMMLAQTKALSPACIVYDCMDELSHFKFAPPDLVAREQALLSVADVVFTGGYSLYAAKKSRHPNVHPYPSSVDHDHFAAARRRLPDPQDQAGLGRPRLGYYGVVDERMDLELLAALADARPQWSLVVIGPVVKVDPADLPRRDNIHYLGARPYERLPAYLAGWDVALMPFAINEATRFISPTKTPEYLAAGKPVVSTPISDVIRTYGAMPGVLIASGAEAFVKACESALALPGSWREAADVALRGQSWDDTYCRMRADVMQATALRCAPFAVGVQGRGGLRPRQRALRRGSRLD